jgi:hypothetical protein
MDGKILHFRRLLVDRARLSGLGRPSGGWSPVVRELLSSRLNRARQFVNDRSSAPGNVQSSTHAIALSAEDLGAARGVIAPGRTRISRSSIWPPNRYDMPCAVRHAGGRPAQLKVSVGYIAGYVGDGEIACGGTNALARARLAADIVGERLDGQFAEIRVDLIGSTSLHGRAFFENENPYEVRLRIAARAATPEQAALVGEEIEALYTNGPAGGGGARRYVQEQIGIVSTLIDRERVRAGVTIRERAGHAETV